MMENFTSGGGANVAETVLFATAKTYDLDRTVTREDSSSDVTNSRQPPFAFGETADPRGVTPR